ncbi:Hypothetical Protein FCC1311_102472 [Hondaea fermentalgiana]|uniref:Phosphatidic acid phosphatase type 2/haloperoxidase domain-containing protein n=1 Tax=Hondaea fermentalgiana TaxID=2315210 RepID=A0A2R5H124_9STRA|nr:Hypothetical Protein FCC1311_102472 [Hondaea fermentalgiana]|eukprot:GBG34024.1 Hypothetical Protein FCC1311_102472 [Hondaea fermentalgiana]
MASGLGASEGGGAGDGGARRVPSQESLEEEEDSFQVRDLLIWSAEDSRARKPAEPRGEGRLAYKEFSVDAVGLFYTFCVFLLLAVAELVMKPHLEKVGSSFIKQMQAGGHGGEKGAYVDFFGRIMSFPTDFWGFMPSIALAGFPAGRPLAARMILLVGVGLVVQWTMNVTFRQGRPFWVDRKLEMWHCPTNYGFPSGHAFILLLIVAPLVEELWAWRRRTRRRMRSKPAASSCFSLPCGGGKALLPLLGSSLLVAAYTTCLVGRMYLGTHFLHSLLMGTVCGALLLQILTKRNVAILIDRIALTVELDAATSLLMRAAEVLARAAGVALVLLGATELYLLLCEHLASQDPDPPRWAERALKECRVTLHTLQGSEVKAFNGIAIIVGWLIAVALAAMRPGGVSSLIDGRRGPDGNRPYALSLSRTSPRHSRLRKDSQGADVLPDEENPGTGAGPYGTMSSGRVLRSPSSSSSALSFESVPELELCNVGALLAIASFISKMAMGYTLAYLLHMPSLGRLLAVICALFVFPQLLFISRPSCSD